MLLTRSPLIHPASWASAFDLHVLSTPPAFVLSQDQTLRTKTKTLKPRKTNQKTRSAIPTKNTQKQKTGIKKQTNTLSSSQTTPARSSAHEYLACFRKAVRAMFPRPELFASFAAVRRNKENNTQFFRHRQIKRNCIASQYFSAEYQRLKPSDRHNLPQNHPISCARPQRFSRNVRQHSQRSTVTRPPSHAIRGPTCTDGRCHHVF